MSKKIFIGVAITHDFLGLGWKIRLLRNSQRTKSKSVRTADIFCKRMGRETIAHLNGHSFKLSGDRQALANDVSRRASAMLDFEFCPSEIRCKIAD